jgi:hypothetical protein
MSSGRHALDCATLRSSKRRRRNSISKCCRTGLGRGNQTKKKGKFLCEKIKIKNKNKLKQLDEYDTQIDD